MYFVSKRAVQCLLLVEMVKCVTPILDLQCLSDGTEARNELSCFVKRLMEIGNTAAVAESIWI